MIFCKDLDRNFETKEKMFSALRENHEKLKEFKKKTVFYSKDKGTSIKRSNLKGIKESELKQIVDTDKYFYIAVNTTKVLDSHLDLHLDNIWNRSAKNQNRKNYLVDSHIFTMSATIAAKEDVEIMVVDIPFSAIGSSLPGMTQALVYRIEKDKILDEKAKTWLEEGKDIEASVKMQYVDIKFAMNSFDPEDREFKACYDQYISIVANKQEYEEEYGEINYFWAVSEAKNIDESSLVLRGSNPETGQIIVGPSNDTQQQDSEKSRLEEVRKYLINKN